MPGEEEGKSDEKIEMNKRFGRRNNNFYRDNASREFHNGNGFRYNSKRNIQRFGGFRGRGYHVAQGLYFLYLFLIFQCLGNRDANGNDVGFEKDKSEDEWQTIESKSEKR